MGEVIVCLLMAVFFLSLGCFFAKLQKDTDVVKYESEGTFLRFAELETTKSFYMGFTTIDGKYMEGYTKSYITTNGKVKLGDKVKIKYMFTPNGTPRIEIDEEGFVLNKPSMKPVIILMIVLAIVFVLLAIGQMV